MLARCLRPWAQVVEVAAVVSAFGLAFGATERRLASQMVFQPHLVYLSPKALAWWHQEPVEAVLVLVVVLECLLRAVVRSVW